MQETQIWSLGREDSLEEEIATNSSILAWKIPWTDESGGLVHRVTKSWIWLGVTSEWVVLLTHTKPNVFDIEIRNSAISIYRVVSEKYEMNF